MAKQSQLLQTLIIQRSNQYEPPISSSLELKNLARRMINRWQFLSTTKVKLNISPEAKLLKSCNQWLRQPIPTWPQTRYQESLLTLGEFGPLFSSMKQVNHQTSSSPVCITWVSHIASICKTHLLFNTSTSKPSKRTQYWLQNYLDLITLPCWTLCPLIMTWETMMTMTYLKVIVN